ncbi:hypothetical protein LPB140_04340 [Sphingorhabdus lutea]|uniref:Alpha/beta hydrolase fold-3 domain-containing protein n=1 Tax=Sphingorhabdus lutea TaxID=1913578 RepID=A0A1L3JAS5_9SPHN|nr:alpha/beta hydrolase [Sphingorhabdus lutea]APG62163.1 hypothetical protein LPB140_04340 [Sphingorhabdus lutea]
MAISIQARVVNFILRKTGIYKKLFSGGPKFPAILAKARATPLPQPKDKWRAKLTIKQSQFNGHDIWHFAPKNGQASANILFWHGGGYVYSAADAHLDFMAHMADKYGWNITAPLYPLSPEFTAEHIQKWAVDFYIDYLAKLDGAPFIMGGDSAGGGMTATIAQHARGNALGMANALILICPWLKLSPDYAEQQIIEPRDAILSIRGIDDAAKLYAAHWEVDDPRVSPIFGDWSGLPPILCFGGGDDILVTNARALHEKLPNIEYIELAQMIHDWPIFIFPESRKAQAKIAQFASQNIKAA